MSNTASTQDKWSAQHYNDQGSFVYSQANTSSVLTLLNAQTGERICDFGCGSGDLSVQIACAVGEQGTVVGVDSSLSMLEQAKKNGLKHAFLADVQEVRFPEDTPEHLTSGFDAVFSNAALHWCKRNPKGVVESARKLLKPGGRFVAEMGGFLNIVGIRTAMYAVLKSRGYDPVKLDPWYFPSVEEYKKLLESSEFQVHEIGLHPRPTLLPNRLYDWLNLYVRKSILGGMGEAEAEEIMREAEQLCDMDCRDESGRWTLMYVRLRFFATLAV